MGKTEKPVTQTSANLYLDEIMKAAKRIGDTTDSAGAWLARFARTNLQDLSTRGWSININQAPIRLSGRRL